jgi:hypothetical protein
MKEAADRAASCLGWPPRTEGHAIWCSRFWTLIAAAGCPDRTRDRSFSRPGIGSSVRPILSAWRRRNPSFGKTTSKEPVARNENVTGTSGEDAPAGNFMTVASAGVAGTVLNRARGRRADQGADPAARVATKTEFNGIGGSASYISIMSICATPSWLANGRFIGHARDRCFYRCCRRRNCACSSLFTLGTKWAQMTRPKQWVQLGGILLGRGRPGTFMTSMLTRTAKRTLGTSILKCPRSVQMALHRRDSLPLEFYFRTTPAPAISQ